MFICFDFFFQAFCPALVVYSMVENRLQKGFLLFQGSGLESAALTNINVKLNFFGMLFDQINLINTGCLVNCIIFANID